MTEALPIQVVGALGSGTGSGTWSGSKAKGTPASAVIEIAPGSSSVSGSPSTTRWVSKPCGTQTQWLVKGLDPTVKSARLANYLITLRKEILALSHACGQLHPSLVPLDRFDIVDGLASKSARDVFGYQAGWGEPHVDEKLTISGIMSKSA